MRTRTIMLCTVALSLGACNSHNSIWSSSGPRYTPRADISRANTTQETRRQEYNDTVSYQQYEHREPCQQYRKPPRHYSDGCVDEVIEQKVVVLAEPIIPPKKAVLPIVSSYTVLFDFDKFDIRPNETATLDKAKREIDKYHPKQVTVTGYTDSHGTSEYNQTLSEAREGAVSRALMKRGIPNQTLSHEARGEYEQAVKTADGVKNQENRRVVIDFRR